MPKPKKTHAIQNKKIKQLKARLRTAIKKIRKLKRRNLALQRIRPPPRTFKYRPRIIRILDVETVHRFSRRPLEIRLKSQPRPLTLNLQNPPPPRDISNTNFQIRLKSRPPPQITKPPELQEFHYFPYLPFEVRVPIWKLAIDAAPGRDVMLRVDPLERGNPNALEWAEMSSSTEIPALLHTCHLSRSLARHRWQLCMAAYDGDVGKVYVDAETDSIFFPCLITLWHWQGKGNEREVDRMAAGRRMFVSHNGAARNCSHYETFPPGGVGWSARLDWIGRLEWGEGWHM
jgi:hypothetical protein